jgi:hypothetical protein
MAKYLVVSTSGNPDSNSRRMGRIQAKAECDWLDLSEPGLPLCKAVSPPIIFSAHDPRRQPSFHFHR